MDLILVVIGEKIDDYYNEYNRIFVSTQKAKKWIESHKNKNWTDYSIYSCTIVEHNTHLKNNTEK